MTFLRGLNEDGSAAFIDHSLGFSLEDDLAMLNSCNGLLLFGRCVYRENEFIDTIDLLEYVVYNPAAKRSVRIPIPSDQQPEVMPYGFASDGRNYHVVRFCRCVYNKDETLDFHIFSSETGEWDEKKLTKPSLAGVDYGLDLTPPVNYAPFLKGAIHWVLKNSLLLIYHLKGEYFKLIQLPICNNIGLPFCQCIWHSEGCLYYCRGNKDGIRIWVLHLEGMEYPRNLSRDFKWRLKHDVVLTTLMPESAVLMPESRGAFRPCAFVDDFETVYLVYNYRLLSYKPDTRVLKEVCISNFGRVTCVYPFVYNPVHDFPQQIHFPS